MAYKTKRVCENDIRLTFFLGAAFFFSVFLAAGFFFVSVFFLGAVFFFGA